MKPRHARSIGVLLALAAPALGANPIPFPHPQITEVLFNVPAGDGGDASGDGTRDAAGDEFIEIANPHKQPINLKGYTLSSRLAAPDRATGKGVRFVFPDCELPPHGVAVVFNGFSTRLPDPVGSQEAAPLGPSRAFDGALVFSINTSSKSAALSNSGDFIMLCDPEGRPLDVVWWGDPSPRPPAGALRAEEVKATVKGSVQRLAPDEPLAPHSEIGGAPFSPGSIPRAGAAPKPPSGK